MENLEDAQIRKKKGVIDVHFCFTLSDPSIVFQITVISFDCYHTLI